MGILQDIIARLSKSTSKKKKRYSYSPAKNRLRWSVLGGTVISFLCGFTFIVGLLEPYSAYGRIVVHVFKPIYMLGNNLLESAFSKFDNYTFYQVDTSILSISSLFIAVVILTMIFIMAWKHGRTWCNTICPVGTILGLLSRFSLFKVRIDSDKCNSCGLCATKCKAACINSKEHTIDYGRCVDCFDCLGAGDVYKRQDYLLPEQFRNYFHKLKNPLQVWKVKKYTKKRIRLLRRGLSAVNIFSSNVHRAIFVSANAHRMY